MMQAFSFEEPLWPTFQYRGVVLRSYCENYCLCDDKPFEGISLDTLALMLQTNEKNLFKSPFSKTFKNIF